jgi:alanyl-tRNA synthetase
MEFWNLVFMQYHEDGSGKLQPLPRPSIDTGGGLERMTTILQGEINNYHTDVFQDPIGVAAQKSGHRYMKNLNDLSPQERESQDAINVALRVLADHGRTIAFLIADGVLPSNEGRGYVLRRIMRRAIRYGRKLSETESLLPAVVNASIGKMGSFYRELEQQQSLIERTVQEEEVRFLATLDQGTLSCNSFRL